MTGTSASVKMSKTPKKMTIDTANRYYTVLDLFSGIGGFSLGLERTGGFQTVAFCGGFPCQDISAAGRQKGLAGERSGLWFEMLRVISETKPEWAIIENVANLRSNGLATVLQGLWQIGYDAEWHIIPACSVGAPHKRERIWIIANRDGLRVERARTALEAAGIDKCIRGNWPGTQPGAMRVDDGFSAEVHRNRIRQLGNAVVPQIPEMIGRAILSV